MQPLSGSNADLAERLAAFLQNQLAVSGLPRSRFLLKVAEEIGCHEEVAEALVTGIIPVSELDRGILLPIARLFRISPQDFAFQLDCPLEILSDEVAFVDYRYRILAPLGTGSMGTVYSARDRLTKQVIAIKHVTIPLDHLEPSSQHPNPGVALANEFRVLASLRHPHIISVIDYGFDHFQRPYFTMDLLRGAVNILEAGRHKTQQERISFILQILNALSYLHQRRVLHRDLKPSNILVADNQTTVLDFGLSARQDKSSGVVGTLKWMAPEVFQGETHSQASDLYAVGMIAYELLTGSYPYRDDTQLTHSIMNEMPDLTQVAPALVDVLRCLLEKKPSHRYKTAIEAAEALALAAGLPKPQTHDQLHDYSIQAAPFIGRAEELATLQESLQQLLGGKGQAYLIRGESGIGKTRLLKEIVTTSMVKGVFVLRGQATNNTTVPYQLWIEVLRHLLLRIEVAPDEASVLKPLVTDIASLVEYPVEDVPELPSRAANLRLIAVIETLFRRIQDPILLILEDLHWASEESLQLLISLSQIPKEQPCLILVSYRSDEAPALPSRLPEMQVLRLNRFSKSDTVELCQALLNPKQYSLSLVDMLQQQTSGNIFFLIEYIRLLRQENFQGHQGVFPFTVQQILRRRFASIPAEAYSLLKFAALMGRQLNLNILGNLVPNLEVLLAKCLDIVLEIDEGHWQFAHERLREEILQTIPDTEKCTLHRQIAETLTVLYGEAGEYIMRLAYHWSQAIYYDIPTPDLLQNVLNYQERAATYALEHYAFHEAIEFFNKAIELGEGHVSVERRILWEKMQGQAYLKAGHLEASAYYFQRTLALMKRPMPGSKLGLSLEIMIQVIKQILYRLSVISPRTMSTDETEKLLETMQVYDALIEIHVFFIQAPQVIYCLLASVNLTEQVGISLQRKLAYSLMSVVVAYTGLQRLARYYYNKAQPSASDSGYLRARIEMGTGTYDIMNGRWSIGEERFYDAVQIYLTGESTREHCEALGGLTGIALLQGDFKRADALASEILQVAQQRRFIPAQTWGLDGRAACLIHFNQLDEALICLEQSYKMLSQTDDQIEALSNDGLYALAAWRSGNHPLAFEKLTSMVNRFSNVPLLWSALIPISAITSVIIELPQASTTEPEVVELYLIARVIERYLRSYKRGFPIAKPMVYRYQGALYWQAGKLRPAIRAWRQSLLSAQELDMHYDLGLAHLMLGRHTHNAVHLERAIEIFTLLRLDHERQQASSALLDIPSLPL
jgi:eukaryotic-like serine/threonine-protein kinase